MVSRRLNKVIKRHLHRNAIRRNSVRSSNSLNGITPGGVRSGRRWRRGRGLGEGIRVGEAVSATDCQQGGKDRVDLLVRDYLPVSSEIETGEERC